MSDAILVAIGLALVALVPFPLQVAWELRRVYRRHPSQAIGLMRAFGYAIAAACLGFAVIGANTVVTRVLPDVGGLPAGAGMLILLLVAFILHVPAHLFHREVVRLERKADFK